MEDQKDPEDSSTRQESVGDDQQSTSLPRGAAAAPIEDMLTLEHLRELKQRLALGSSSTQGKLTKEQFRELLTDFLQERELESHFGRMFSKMNVTGDGLVDWEEFCSYMLTQYLEKDSLKQKMLPFQDPPKVRSMFCKETICRVLSISGPARILSVCKDASVGVWSPSLQFQQGFVACEEDACSASGLYGAGGSSGRRSKVMVTDCVLMENCSKLVLALTKRELQFHDIPSGSNTGQTMKIKVFDLPCVPLCLDYYGNVPGEPSHLLYGDDNGDVHVMTFVNPCTHLFVADTRKSSGVSPRISYNLLQDQAPHVLHQVVSGLHSDWVHRVQYLPENHGFLSCSSSQPSLIIKDLLSRQKAYTFRIRKGVECFAYDSDLAVLVTGGMDHAVRLWNPYVTSKPIAHLQQHTTTILDLVMYRELGLLFSYSQDGVMCAWDLYEHSLVQVICVKFPFIQRHLDHGSRPLIRGFRSFLPSLIVTSNEFLAEYELGTLDSTNTGSVVTTHPTSITAAVYSPLFRQVIVGCEGSTVTVWDIDSGNKVLHFPRCHGNTEITCLQLDSSGRRLITGSRYGDVKVWNYHTGECLKNLHHAHKTEVTRAVSIADKGLLFTVGWNKQITAFRDEEDVFDATPMGGWEERGMHSEDILCLSYLPPRFLATGSFDGVIKVWNIESTQLVRQFTSPSLALPVFDPTRNLRKSSCASFRVGTGSVNSSHLSGPASRPASRRRSLYRLKLASTQFKRAPVDQILFLRNRASSKLRGCGTLVTSDHGQARFWDLFGPDEPLGSFPLTQNPEEQVVALSTDRENHVLVAGDTAGLIAVFDMKDYCMVTGKSYSPLVPIRTWMAHGAEVTSLQLIGLEREPLVLSASADATVRLWTLKGHYIGTFGQDKAWDLDQPSSFQHPKTPWGDMQQPRLAVSRLSTSASSSYKSMSEAVRPAPPTTAGDTCANDRVNPIATIQEGEGELVGDEAPSIPNGVTDSTVTLKDQNALGQRYKKQLVCRMRGRKERREVYSEIDLRSTQRFGAICSPFQALQLTSVDDLPVLSDKGRVAGEHGTKNAVKLQSN